MNKNAWLILVSFVCLGCPSGIQAQVGPTDNVYFPGQVDVQQAPLADYLPASMKSACDDLIAGKLSSAEASFSAYLGHHPYDYAAYIGYLQAVRGHRARLLSAYQHDVRRSATAINYFKLGALAFYLFGERYASTKPIDVTTSQLLRQITTSNLQKAYRLSHNPVVGLFWAASMGYTHDPYADRKGDPDIYEEIIKYTGGDEIYRAYEQAKRSDWSSPLPPSGHLGKSDDAALCHVVHIMWYWTQAQRSTVHPHIVNNVVVSVSRERLPLTEEQVKKAAYLRKWMDNLK